MRRKTQSIVMGLDIGTTKVCALIGEVQDEGQIDVIGVGIHPSRGLNKGVVVNIDSTVESIRRAVNEAQLMAGVEVPSAYVGIAGGHITGINSTGIIAVRSQDITLREVNQVIEAAKAVALPMDREVIHVLPQEFIVDDQDGVMDPLGMSAVRLEAKVHIVTAAVTSAHNIVKCVNNAGLEVEDIILEQLASGAATLTPEERDYGAVIIDIGGGTTDIALLAGDSVKHTAVLAVGGNHITNDLAFGLGAPVPEAERVKKAFGCAHASLVDAYEMIEVRGADERPAQKYMSRDLCDIIEPRVEEMLHMARREILQSGYAERLPAGIVLTGGTASLRGIVELAEDIFGCAVRCGVPRDIGGLVGMVNTPMYATGVGLLQCGVKQIHYGRFHKFNDDHLFAKLYHRMCDWFGELLT